MEFNYSKPTLEILDILNPSITSKDYAYINSFIIKNNMAPFYKHLTEKLSLFEYDDSIYSEMHNNNKNQVKTLLDQKNPENESQCFEIDQKISEYYASILDIDNFYLTARELTFKNVSSSLRMDIILCKMRLSIIYDNKQDLKKIFAEGEDVVKRGCDWDRRNKFKTYAGFFHVLNKDHLKASQCFCDALATFKSKELLTYEKCVFYFLFAGVLSFERVDLNEKLLCNSDVLETINANNKGIGLVNCLYNCDYDNFMKSFVLFAQEVNEDFYINKQIDFFVREVKIKIYKQLLESYKSLSLNVFCDILKVREEYVEKDLCDFIIDQRLNCVIDRCSKVVEIKEKIDTAQEDLVTKGEQLMRLVQKNLK